MPCFEKENLKADDRALRHSAFPISTIQKAPPAGFEPAISTVTRWRALLAALRGRGFRLRTSHLRFQQNSRPFISPPAIRHPNSKYACHAIRHGRWPPGTGEIRTHTRSCLRRLPLPLGYGAAYQNRSGAVRNRTAYPRGTWVTATLRSHSEATPEKLSTVKNAHRENCTLKRHHANTSSDFSVAANAARASSGSRTRTSAMARQ